MNFLLPMLSWPDLIVGAGLMGGSMILSLEQLVIDAEVFRMAKQAHRGVSSRDEMWLDNVIQRVGPGGNFLGEKSTAINMRSGEWLIPKLGVHKTQGAWEDSGKKDILEEAREKVEHLLATHKPLPLGDDVEKELENLQTGTRGSWLTRLIGWIVDEHMTVPIKHLSPVCTHLTEIQPHSLLLVLNGRTATRDQIHAEGGLVIIMTAVSRG
jgi:hypothetical protein